MLFYNVLYEQINDGDDDENFMLFRIVFLDVLSQMLRNAHFCTSSVKSDITNMFSDLD